MASTLGEKYISLERKPCCGDGVLTVFSSCTHVSYSNSVVFSEGPPEIWTVGIFPFQCCEYKTSDCIYKKVLLNLVSKTKRNMCAIEVSPNPATQCLLSRIRSTFSSSPVLKESPHFLGLCHQCQPKIKLIVVENTPKNSLSEKKKSEKCISGKLHIS